MTPDPLTKKEHPSQEERLALPPFDELPLQSIKIITERAHFEEAIARFEKARYVGFDTESRPAFTAGKSTHGPHLVQFAIDDAAYLFQTRYSDLIDCLKIVLQSEHIIKVGFGIRSDKSPLQANWGIDLKGYIELTQPLRSLGYKNDLGARAAVAVVLRQNLKKSKRTTLTNWEAPNLTPAQMRYAANDALAALRVFDAIGRPLPPAAKTRPRRKQADAVATETGKEKKRTLLEIIFRK
jgi:ribonuclease D